MTINVLGQPFDYYQKLQKKAKEAYNIDIVIENSCAINGTGNMRNRVANDDAPDIITSASLFFPEQQKTRLLDLAQYSLVDSFKERQLSSLSLNGGIYQIPLSCKRIGIQYNRTLFKEQGWKLPQNYQDVVKLIPQIQSAGYDVCTTVADYTCLGYSFNYLFHFAGPTYLSTPDGCIWFEDFISGKSNSTEALYSTMAFLKKLKDCGFFGTLTSPNAFVKFRAQRRSPFCIDIIMPIGSNVYSNWHYDRTGNVIDGKYEEHESGSLVCLNGVYTPFDKSNVDHKKLKRYNLVDGKKLNDEFGIMPWFNENGDNNCYCIYYNFLVSLNRHLNDPGQENRLKQALAVLQIMSSPEFTQYFLAQSSDVYSPTKDFHIDESRAYYDFADAVNNNYIMPWYYASFDDEVICSVGRIMNAWFFNKTKQDGSPVTSDDVLNQLRTSQTGILQKDNSQSSMATVPQDLSIQESAELLALAIGMGIQHHFQTTDAKLPQPQEVKLALIPFAGLTDARTGMACTSRIYHGIINYPTLTCLVPARGTLADAIMLTGAEIKALLQNNNNPNVYPHYAAVFHGDTTLDDATSYFVAILAKGSLPADLLEAKTQQNHYITCKIQVLAALQALAPLLGEITPKSIHDYAQTGDWNAFKDLKIQHNH